MTEQQDTLAERDAIMAEANGWPQDKAERTIAWDRGFGTCQEMWRVAGAVKQVEMPDEPCYEKKAAARGLVNPHAPP